MTILHNGEIINAGGYWDSSSEIYNPRTHLWREYGSLPDRYYEHTAVTFKYTPYIFGGTETPNDVVTYHEGRSSHWFKLGEPTL